MPWVLQVGFYGVAGSGGRDRTRRLAGRIRRRPSCIGANCPSTGFLRRAHSPSLTPRTAPAPWSKPGQRRAQRLPWRKAKLAGRLVLLLLMNVPSRARTRARDTSAHARRLGCTDRRTNTRYAQRRRCGAGAAQSVRAHARRAQIQSDQDRGAELRDRAPEALALRLVQRELGGEHASSAVRRPPDRHRARRPRGPGKRSNRHPQHPRRRSARRCPRACRASSITTRSRRPTAPVAKPSNASAKR